MTYARIISTGISLPEKVMTNDDLAKIVDTSDEWISTRTGIRERRVAGPDEAASDFGAEAAKRALEAAGMEPDEMDAIIVGTITPDNPFPATACLIQEKLGATKPFAFDVSAACSGYLYILSIANAYIQSRRPDYGEGRPGSANHQRLHLGNQPDHCRAGCVEYAGRSA